MKYIYLLLAVFIFWGCSKEEGYGPLNLKNGQEVEISVGHYYGSIYDPMILRSNKRDTEIGLYNFTERQAGYEYQVKARMVAPKDPPQDGSAYYLEFIKVLQKKKYEGKDSFRISLIHAPVPGTPRIAIRKDQDSYWLTYPDIQLTFQDPEVGKQLELIWEERVRNIPNVRESNNFYPKWKSITATVIHDPANFGKAYLLAHIEFVE